MSPHRRSSVAERLALVGWLRTEPSVAAASQRVGFSADWGERWARRYRAGGSAALQPSAPTAPGPLARQDPTVATAVLAIRRRHPRLGGRRARLELAADPALAGKPIPSARTIHRAWRAAGLVATRPPRQAPPPSPPLPVAGADPHAVWQIDHQDHLSLGGVAAPVVLQSVRAPAAGLVVGADLFPGPRGAQGVPLDDVLDALRRGFATWGRPLALSVDGGLHFLGQPQRQFPSRLELLCAGLGVTVVAIRPGRPTDHGAVERQHAICDGFLLGPTYPDLPAAQTALDAHVTRLNTAFPSRARVCGGHPPLEVRPAARHSGRPYDPAREAADFDVAAVDRLLATWRWERRVGRRSGQLSFADRPIHLGRAWAGQIVPLRFDPTDRRVVVYAPGPAPDALGPELTRFPCAAFDPATIRGRSRVAIPPSP